MSDVDPTAAGPSGADAGAPPPPPVDVAGQPVDQAGRSAAPDAGDAELVEAVDVARALEKERDEYLDLARRVQADFENYKRRVETQREEQRERAAEDLARELLPVLDAGEAAAVQGHDDVAMLHQQLLLTLEKRGLTRLGEAGVGFDPNVHEAVIHEPGDESAPVVIEVMRTGYLWNQRVLRPAMVRVRG